MSGIDDVAKELSLNLQKLSEAFHVETWRCTVMDHIRMLDALHALFGSDNVITEHFDTLIELYTDATERAAGLPRGTLIDIWLCGAEFNEEEYQLLIKKIGE